MKKENISIQTILLFFFLLISITPLVVNSLIGFWKSSQTIESNAAQYITQILKQTNREIDYKLKLLSDTHISLLTNNDIQNMLKKNQVSYLEHDNLFHLINQYTLSSSEVKEVSIYNKNGVVLMSNLARRIANLPSSVIQKAILLNGQTLWLGKNSIDQTNNGSIYGVRLIKNLLGPNTDPSGFLVISISEQFVNQSISGLQLGKSGEAIILDSFNNIVTQQYDNSAVIQLIPKAMEQISEHKEGSFKANSAGKNYMIYYSDNQSGFHTVGFIPEIEMTPGMDVVKKSNLVIIVVSIALSLVFSYLISRGLVKPLKILVKQMLNLEIDNTTTPILLKGNKEIYLLSRSFIKMKSRLNGLVHQVYEKEITEKQAELKALQAQINPHFLYNTLDTIYWMLYIKEEEEIGDLVVSLSNLLRYSIKKDELSVTLQDELDHVSNYIKIQSIRFRDRIQFEIDVDPRLTSCGFLRLALQPFVENAIIHGLESNGVSGMIRIFAKSDQEKIIIGVSDNGIGIPESIVKHFNKMQIMGGGIGIQNVVDRIRLHYGDGYGVKIESVEGQGATFLITIPNTILRKE